MKYLHVSFNGMTDPELLQVNLALCDIFSKREEKSIFLYCDLKGQRLSQDSFFLGKTYSSRQLKSLYAFSALV